MWGHFQEHCQFTGGVLVKYLLRAGLPRSGKSHGNTIIFKGQGKVREFSKSRGILFFGL